MMMLSRKTVLRITFKSRNVIIICTCLNHVKIKIYYSFNLQNILKMFVLNKLYIVIAIIIEEIEIQSSFCDIN